MNSHAKWLREAAKEIAAEGHNGWGNTCTDAADEIERLTTEGSELQEQIDSLQQRVHLCAGYDALSAELDSLEKRHTDAVDAWNREIDRNAPLTAEGRDKDTYIDYLKDALDLIANIDLDEPSMGLSACVNHAKGALVPDQDEVVHMDPIADSPKRGCRHCGGPLRLGVLSGENDDRFCSASCLGKYLESTVSGRRECPECGGSGNLGLDGEGDLISCIDCDGKGTSPDSKRSRPCPRCKKTFPTEAEKSAHYMKCTFVDSGQEHDAAFWKRRADQRQIDINELKQNPADAPIESEQGNNDG